MTKSLLPLALILALLLVRAEAAEDGAIAPVFPSATASPGPSAPRVITILDYFDSGRRAVNEFLAGTPVPPNGSRLADVVARSQDACVRVDVRFEAGPDGYRSQQGSGVIVGQGRVLTAGHVFEGVEDYEIFVTLVDGTTRPARLLDRRYDPFSGPDQDWALLELRGAPLPHPAGAEPGEVRRGDLAIVIGYPDGLGVDRRGRVTFAGGIENTYLEPLVTLGTVSEVGPLSLVPRVGSVPTGGMSGAPIFDESGRLIGLFVSVRRIGAEPGVTYAYGAAIIPPFAALGAPESP